MTYGLRSLISGGLKDKFSRHSLSVLILSAGLFNHAVAAPNEYNNKNVIVNMYGSIVDTACAIATEDRQQIIEMDSAVAGTLMREGVGAMRHFAIHLKNCTLKPYRPGRPDWSMFRITFDGATDESGLFAVSGDAKGIGIEITDAAGNVAAAGKAMPDSPLQTGNMTLDYILRLKSNHQPLQEGEYWSTIRFRTDYY